MRFKRSLPILLAVLVVAGAVALVVVLRKHAPPEAARLLPGADGFVYVNLQWMRRIDLIGELPPVPHDPEYEQFLQATDFQFERDLEEAAVAIHYPTSLPGAGAQVNEARFSEVFVGKIQGEKLRAYLQKLSSSVETDKSIDIYSIPLQGRTLRVAILGVDTVAASNHPDPQVIRGIVERSRKLASPFGGPALLRQYYQREPIASLAWAIFRVFPSSGSTATPGFDWNSLFSKQAVVVASARYLRALHLKIAAVTQSPTDAKQVTDQLSTFLALFRAAESTSEPSGTDQDVKAVLDSLKVEQENERTILTGTIPPGFIQKALAQGPSIAAPPAPQPPAPTPEPPANHKRKGRATAKPKT